MIDKEYIKTLEKQNTLLNQMLLDQEKKLKQILDKIDNILKKLIKIVERDSLK